MLGFGFTFDPVLHIEPLLTLMDSGVQCACSVVDCNNESSCFEGRWVVVLTIYAHTHTQSNTAQGIAATTAEKMLDAGCPICIRAPAQALCAAQDIIMTSVMTCARQKFSRPGWQSQCSGQSCRLQRLTRSQRGGQEREREREGEGEGERGRERG